jgi:hypothetical protein
MDTKWNKNINKNQKVVKRAKYGSYNNPICSRGILNPFLPIQFLPYANNNNHYIDNNDTNVQYEQIEQDAAISEEHNSTESDEGKLKMIYLNFVKMQGSDLFESPKLSKKL